MTSELIGDNIDERGEIIDEDVISRVTGAVYAGKYRAINLNLHGD